MYYSCSINRSFGTKKTHQFLYSPFNIIALAIIAIIAFVFSFELIFYCIVILYALYVIAFCPDLAPLMPLFALCYVTVSKNNNPGISDQGIFYGKTATFILYILAIVIVALIFRISLDKKIGWKLFITKRRSLLPGMLILSMAYLISGIGNEHYFEYIKSNLIFALIQALSLCLLYFFFSATVWWERFNADYFAYIGLITGFVVVFELAWVYLTEDIIIDGVVERINICTGWGTYNNMGAIIALAVPFAFYFACKKRHSGIYLLLALLLMIGVVFSCSRNSMICAAITFIISYIYTFIKAKNKKEFRILSLVLVVVFIVCELIFFESTKEIFENVPNIADVIDGNVVFNDSGRVVIYVEGWKAFLRNPIFGQTFYSFDYDLCDFSEVDQFSAFFPPRWHNTFIQLLASCGLIGFWAYLYHRYKTIKLFVKKRTQINIYIGIYIFTLLCLSMFDCHFFNVGPTLMYSMALAVMEYGKTFDNVNN